MFIASYATYIGSHPTTKHETHKEQRSSGLFSGQFYEKLQTPSNYQSAQTQQQIDYISHYKTLNLKTKIDQKLHQDMPNQEFLKFSLKNSQTGAKSSYAENSVLFSLIKKPGITLAQAPHAKDENPPKIVRSKVANTYLENDNYFKKVA